MFKNISLLLFWFSISYNCWSQDTLTFVFRSKFHNEHDYRDYNYELNNCVDFAYNNTYISGLNDGYYLFKDSLSNYIRLKGEVKNSRLVNKWSYFDSIGRKRIEDIFFNDIDSTILTSYYDENGILYRTKESSYKFLKTIHFLNNAVSTYYFQDFIDSSNVQMEFFEDGHLRHRSSSKKDLKNGEFYWAYDDKTLYAQQFYDKGLKVGTWKSGFKGSKEVWCTETYENDLLKSISFSKSKTYKIENGTIEILDFYPSGKLRLKGKVIDGVKIGKWLFYDEKGNIVGEFNHDLKGNLTSSSKSIFTIPGI